MQAGEGEGRGARKGGQIAECAEKHRPPSIEIRASSGALACMGLLGTARALYLPGKQVPGAATKCLLDVVSCDKLLRDERLHVQHPHRALTSLLAN